MPTKQDIITWLIVALICAMLFAIGCVRENNASGNANANINADSHINAKIKSNGNFILCDTTAFHNNTCGE